MANVTTAAKERPRSSRLTREIFWQGLGIIGRHLAPHRREILVLVGLSVISAAAEAFVPYLGGKVLDAIIRLASVPVASLGGIGAVIAVWFGLKLITDIADWQINSRESWLGTRIYGEYIAAGFGKMLLLPISFHKARKEGEVGERINRAANWLNTLVESVIIHLAPRFLSVVAAIAITFFINGMLAAVLVIAVLIYITILARSVGDLAYLQRKMNRSYQRAFGLAYDAIGNIHEIKQATAEEFEGRRLHRWFVGIAGRLWFDMNAIFRRLDFWQRLIVSVTQLAIFSISIVLVRNGVITVGELVAFNGYAAMLFGPFVVLGNNWNAIQNGLVALVQAEKVLSLPPESYVPENAVILPAIKGLVAFERVSFSHDKRREVLRNISFTAEPGETIALVGESGVGKTTLIELLLGFYFPKEGHVFIDGHDIRTLDLKNYRRQLATVPQEISLFNDTIAMNIRYGNFGADDAAVERAARDAHAAEFIESFPEKYRQRVGWRGVKLSTGQKQRLAIARAMLRDPKILILDEPTSALDARSEEMLKESLERLMRGRTTFIIAHRLSTVRRADRIIVLDKGTIAEAGTHNELLAKGGIYKELHDLQFAEKRDE